MNYVLNLAAILALLTPLGWNTAALRFIPEYRNSREWGLLRGVIVRAHQTTLLCSLAIGAGLLLFSFMPVSASAIIPLRFTGLLVPLLSLIGVRQRVFRGLNEIKASVLPDEVLLPTMVLSALLIVQPGSPSAALALYCVCALVVLLAAAQWLRRRLPREVIEARAAFHTASWARTALPLLLGSFSLMLVSRTAILVLGWFASPAIVGLYSAAARLSVLNVFVLGLAVSVVPPLIAAAHFGGRKEDVSDLMRVGTMLAGFGAAPLAFVMLVWPHTVLGVFGTGFEEAAPLLRILAVGQFVNALTGPVAFGLTMTGQERFYALSVGIAAATNVAGLLIAVPHFGAIGAAVVTALTISALNITQVVALWIRVPHARFRLRLVTAKNA